MVSNEPSIKLPFSFLNSSTTTTTTTTTPGFVSSLKLIPVKKFVSSRSLSRTSLSEIGEYQSSSGDIAESPDDQPLCSICLEPYADGDPISNLACSHCFHTECVNAWFYQGCLDDHHTDGHFNCPECRQEHIFSDTNSDDKASDSGATSSSSTENEEPFVMLGDHTEVQREKKKEEEEEVAEGSAIFPPVTPSSPTPTTRSEGSIEIIESSDAIHSPMSTPNSSPSSSSLYSSTKEPIAAIPYLPIPAPTLRAQHTPMDPIDTDESSSSNSTGYISSPGPSTFASHMSYVSLGSPWPGPGIDAMAFLHAGQSLVDDGGYDFLSDIDSTTSSPCNSPMRSSPRSPLRSTSTITTTTATSSSASSAYISSAYTVIPTPVPSTLGSAANISGLVPSSSSSSSRVCSSSSSDPLARSSSSPITPPSPKEEFEYTSTTYTSTTHTTMDLSLSTMSMMSSSNCCTPHMSSPSPSPTHPKSLSRSLSVGSSFLCDSTYSLCGVPIEGEKEKKQDGIL